MAKIAEMGGQTLEDLIDRPATPETDLSPYMRAFEILGGAREMETSIGMHGPTVSYKKLKFGDMLEYARAFPDDVDDVRVFVKTMQTIDAEFLKHAVGAGKT